MKAITCAAILLLAAAASAQDALVLKTKLDKDSYAIGVDLARNLKRRGVQLDNEAVFRGIGDVLSAQKPRMTEDDLRQTLLALQRSAVTNMYRSKRFEDGYAVGVELARDLRRRGAQMESAPVLRGMRDVITGQKLLMTDDDLGRTLVALRNAERQRQIVTAGGPSPVAAENAAKGAAFLAQNKTNQNVVCLPSGLQYKVLKAGTGPKPSATDTVECRFLASLIDGRVFAGTNPASPSAALKLSQTIPGLREALQLMPVGSKWKLFIPPQLGYGQEGAGRSRLGAKIGPNETLIYDLELLAIK